MRLQETKETVCPPEVQGVIGKIFQTHPTREEEIKALLTAAEAFKGRTEQLHDCLQDKAHVSMN